jgi:3-hydroxyacyl-CoA dehydrogenase
MVANFQATSQRIKYSLVPVVAAVRGLALGGGCEFQMHSTRTVAALESYIGLVEAGVGLLPAGGGLKEIAVRCGGSRPEWRRVRGRSSRISKPSRWPRCRPARTRPRN